MNPAIPVSQDPPAAAQTWKQARLGRAAAESYRAGWTARQFTAELVRRELLQDAIRVLALALSKRQAVWWAGLCVWHFHRPDPADSIRAIFASVIRWVIDPSESNRQAIRVPGMAVELSTPAGCLAMAAYWSGGSMTEPHLPQVPPPPHLTGRCVGGAVLMAAGQGPVTDIELNQRRYVQLGLEVAEGRNLWHSNGHKTGEQRVLTLPLPDQTADTDISPWSLVTGIETLS